MTEQEKIKEIENFLNKNEDARLLLEDPQKRELLGEINRNFPRINYLLKNPWIDLEQIVKIADGIMNISPDVSTDTLLNRLCRDAAYIINATSSTCRTYDPVKNSMIASGDYNWNTSRTEEIPYSDSIAGQVIKKRTHFCVPDIANEPMYKEKEKLLSMGINSMLAIPIQLIDYEGAEKKEVLIGALQLYFKEKQKTFYPEQIQLIKSIVSRFSYVLAQKRKLSLQKRSIIIQESRKAILSIFKQTESLDQVLSFLVTKIAETINVKRCSLFSIDKDAAEKPFAVLIAGYPLEPFAHRYGITLTFEEHPAFREVYETGKHLLVEDAKHDPRMQASYQLYLHEKIENVYFLPVKDEMDRVVNVIVLDGDETRPLEQDDIFFLNALINDIEVCIQTSRRSQERHDFLNQIYSLGAIARVYTKKLSQSEVPKDELDKLYKKLYRSMLAIEDIVADRVPFAQKEEFEFNKVVAERIDAYYFPPDVEVRHNADEREIFIYADRKKVGRIVGNLLDNAHKKLEEMKKGVLEIYCFTEDNYAVFSIGNSGKIPENVRKLLYQNKPIQRQDRKGSLGLSIVKLFTFMHNGIFEFESSAEHNWTVFRVKLPLG